MYVYFWQENDSWFLYFGQHCDFQHMYCKSHYEFWTFELHFVDEERQSYFHDGSQECGFPKNNSNKLWPGTNNVQI